MIRPPNLDLSFEDLPIESRKRHEALVDAFGQYLFWVRNETLARVRTLVESPESRQQLGTVFRDAYEKASRLSGADREVAHGLVDEAIGSFARLFLTMISGVGFDDRVGANHVLRFRLVMEFCDSETGELISEETINRGGEKFFPEYWGRWLNRYASESAGRS